MHLERTRMAYASVSIQGGICGDEYWFNSFVRFITPRSFMFGAVGGTAPLHNMHKGA